VAPRANSRPPKSGPAERLLHQPRSDRLDSRLTGRVRVKSRAEAYEPSCSDSPDRPDMTHAAVWSSTASSS
jgi:hypothetical protein